MRCFLHDKTDAIGQCNTCNKGVCKECLVEVSRNIFCKTCAAEGKISISAQHIGKKSETTAALIAFGGGLLCVNGGGHIYVGRIGRGIVIFFIGLIIAATMLIGVGLCIYPFYYIWQIYDAYNLAKEYNKEIERTDKAPW